jgi:hypothetical protein
MTGMIARATGATIFYIILAPIKQFACDRNTTKNDLDVPASRHAT